MSNYNNDGDGDEKSVMFTDGYFEKLRGAQSYKDGDVHQATLDVAYDRWQVEDYDSYHDMIEACEREDGLIPALAVLVGKHNHQVCNGGYIQYYDNRYAWRGGKHYWSKNEGGNLDTHDKMIQLWDRFIDNTSSVGRVTFADFSRLIKSFAKEFSIDDDPDSTDICDGCDGSGECNDCVGTGNSNGEDGDSCAECSGGGHCDYCDGEGFFECDNENYGYPSQSTYDAWELLSKSYYKFNEQFMEEFQSWLIDLIEDKEKLVISTKYINQPVGKPNK